MGQAVSSTMRKRPGRETQRGKKRWQVDTSRGRPPAQAETRLSEAQTAALKKGGPPRKRKAARRGSSPISSREEKKKTPLCQRFMSPSISERRSYAVGASGGKKKASRSPPKFHPSPCTCSKRGDTRSSHAREKTPRERNNKRGGDAAATPS